MPELNPFGRSSNESAIHLPLRDEEIGLLLHRLENGPTSNPNRERQDSGIEEEGITLDQGLLDDALERAQRISTLHKRMAGAAPYKESSSGKRQKQIEAQPARPEDIASDFVGFFHRVREATRVESFASFLEKKREELGQLFGEEWSDKFEESVREILSNLAERGGAISVIEGIKRTQKQDPDFERACSAALSLLQEAQRSYPYLSLSNVFVKLQEDHPKWSAYFLFMEDRAREHLGHAKSVIPKDQNRRFPASLKRRDAA